eukprot:CAMPEP_0201118950 /NCGR_PEP_ID=MMETSP0850-20130426/3140_1 /ASSEMBLY_ACC=CAM_ASM_000622 /TAXON_ID=183588 /ORGANISM="Pseudo-nitzschia fraudulenta, Strain WWA7" /LENGTH=255 /DNA_ID=CAMNT_0047384457 /DNA_START=176 /DNA_END=943 /DNA_ORIENTATION=-
MTKPMSFAIGAVAGTFGSLAGMGGGFVMIPLMTSKRLLGLTQHQAHGTSLFAVATTGFAGAISYSGEVDYEVAAAIALCGMATASLGAQASSQLSGPALKKALGVFMLLIAPTIPAKEYVMPKKDETERAAEDPSFFRRYVTPAGIGCCSGFLAGMFGVGGGAIVVPALSFFTDMNHYQALGTSLCAMVPTAVAGTATHMSKGTVAMRVAPALAAGAFIGSFCGGKLGLSIPEQDLKYGFSGTMMVLGARSLFKA